MDLAEAGSRPEAGAAGLDDRGSSRPQATARVRTARTIESTGV